MNRLFYSTIPEAAISETKRMTNSTTLQEGETEDEQNFPLIDQLAEGIRSEDGWPLDSIFYSHSRINDSTQLENIEETTVLAKVIRPLDPAEDSLTEEKSLEKKTKNEFSVTTTAAVVYFDNFGPGSAIDDQFAENQSRGKMSIAYGIHIAYQPWEKITLRTGVTRLLLANSTSHVDLISAVNAEAIDVSLPEVTTNLMGNLNQELGFIEIPLEVEYSIFSKRIGLNLIGGLSTMFLQENAVSLDSGDIITRLGEANNLNTLSFSANVGLGLDYNFFPQIQFNLEPILKYPLNTFRNSSGFNAYYFAIHSGLTYKF